ncbi:MAG: hypothetical protein QY312_01220 [Candidatus Dojkabacteria bacterium]|nr:MAG: hypothetical protein QY312_01220 [Candidatus Dojkabacteria bacterium]
MKTENLRISILALVLATMVLLAPSVSAQTVSPTPRGRMQTSSDVSQQARETAARKGKTIAITILRNQFLQRLNGLRVRVISHKTLDTETKQLIVTKIDEEITWFTTQSQRINEQNDIVAVRRLVREARERFTAVSQEIRRMHIVHGYTVSLRQVLNNLETKFIPVLEKKIEELNNEGIDVSGAQSKMIEVKESYEKAKSHYNALSEAETEVVAKKEFIATREEVKKMRALMAEVLKQIKAN